MVFLFGWHRRHSSDNGEDFQSSEAEDSVLFFFFHTWPTRKRCPIVTPPRSAIVFKTRARDRTAIRKHTSRQKQNKELHDPDPGLICMSTVAPSTVSICQTRRVQIWSLNERTVHLWSPSSGFTQSPRSPRSSWTITFSDCVQQPSLSTLHVQFTIAQPFLEILRPKSPGYLNGHPSRAVKTPSMSWHFISSIAVTRWKRRHLVGVYYDIAVNQTSSPSLLFFLLLFFSKIRITEYPYLARFPLEVDILSRWHHAFAVRNAESQRHVGATRGERLFDYSKGKKNTSSSVEIANISEERVKKKKKTSTRNNDQEQEQWSTIDRARGWSQWGARRSVNRAKVIGKVARKIVGTQAFLPSEGGLPGSLSEGAQVCLRPTGDLWAMSIWSVMAAERRQRTDRSAGQSQRKNKRERNEREGRGQWHQIVGVFGRWTDHSGHESNSHRTIEARSRRLAQRLVKGKTIAWLLLSPADHSGVTKLTSLSLANFWKNSSVSNLARWFSTTRGIVGGLSRTIKNCRQGRSLPTSIVCTLTHCSGRGQVRLVLSTHYNSANCRAGLVDRRWGRESKKHAFLWARLPLDTAIRSPQKIEIDASISRRLNHVARTHRSSMRVHLRGFFRWRTSDEEHSGHIHLIRSGGVSWNGWKFYLLHDPKSEINI